MTPKGSGTEARLIQAAVDCLPGSGTDRLHSEMSAPRISPTESSIDTSPNKEALFRRILVQVLDMIRQAVETAGGAGPDERLRRFVDAIVAFPGDHPDLISVFREGQYRFFEYEQFAAIYQRGLGGALGRDARAGEYLFVLGGVRFCAVRRALHGIVIPVTTCTGYSARGCFRACPRSRRRLRHPGPAAARHPRGGAASA